MLASGLETVSSMLERKPSERSLLALLRLVATFWKATPVVVAGRPNASLYILANPSLPVNRLSVPAPTNFLEDLATASLIPSTKLPFLIRVVVVVVPTGPAPLVTVATALAACTMSLGLTYQRPGLCPRFLFDLLLTYLGYEVDRGMQVQCTKAGL